MKSALGSKILLLFVTFNWSLENLIDWTKNTMWCKRTVSILLYLLMYIYCLSRHKLVEWPQIGGMASRYTQISFAFVCPKHGVEYESVTDQNHCLKNGLHCNDIIILIFLLAVLINSNPDNPQFTVGSSIYIIFTTQDLRKVTPQDSRRNTGAQRRQRELTAKWLHLVEWFANKPQQQYLKRHIKRQEDKIANPPCNPTPL